MSSTVLRIGSYKFFFYANEGDEPRHIHVWSANGQAKFWLEPVELVKSTGYNAHELRRIERSVEENLVLLIEAWDSFFGVSDDE